MKPWGQNCRGLCFQRPRHCGQAVKDLTPMLTNLSHKSSVVARKSCRRLLSASNHEFITSGQKLCAEASDYGVPMRDFLSLAIDPKLSENKAQFSDGNKLVGGYEAALQVLNLPVRDCSATASSWTWPRYLPDLPGYPGSVPGSDRRHPPLELPSGSVREDRRPRSEQPHDQRHELLSTIVDDAGCGLQGRRPGGRMSRVKAKSIRTTQQSVASSSTAGVSVPRTSSSVGPVSTC